MVTPSLISPLALGQLDFFYDQSPRLIARWQPGLYVESANRGHHFPQHFLNFLPLRHGQGSLRPIFGSRMNGLEGT